MEEERVDKPKVASQGKSRAKRIVLSIVLGMVALFVLLPLSLYLPPVQDLACRAVVSWLNASDPELEYQVGQIRIGFPLRLKVRDVNILRRSDGQSLLHVGQLQTGLDDIPLHQPYFVLNQLRVDDLQLGMDSLTASFGLSGTLQRLDAQRIEYDFENSQVRLREAILHSPDLTLYVGPSEPDSIEEPSAPWDINVGRLALHDGQLRYHMPDSVPCPVEADSLYSPYFDYRHFALTGISLEAQEIHYDPSLIRARLNQLTARDMLSGLEVTHGAVTFEMAEDLISAHDLDLALAPRDYLTGDVVLDLALFDTIPSGYATASLRAQLDSANLLRLGAPYLPGLPAHWPDATTQLELRGRITPDSLDLPRLSLTMPGYAELIAEGVGVHIFDNEQRSAAATLKGSLRRSDFLLSALVAPPSERDYRLPDSLTLDMEASQRAARFAARLDLQQQGRDLVRADATYDLQTEAYHLAAQTHQLDVSRFVPSLIADRMTARVLADGRHFRLPGKSTRLEAQVQLDSLLYGSPGAQQDLLSAITLNASLLGGQYVADVSSQHPALGLEAHLEGTFLKDSISAQGYVNAPGVRLDQLPFGLAVPDLGQLGFSSQVKAYYNGDDIAQVHLVLDSLVYSDPNISQHFDDITIHMESEPGILDAELWGGDAQMTIISDCGLRDLPLVLDSLVSEINRQRSEVHLDFGAIQRRLPQLSVDFHMAQDNPFYQAFQYHTGMTFQSVDLQALNVANLSLEGEIINLMGGNGSLSFDTIAITVRPDAADTYSYNFHAMHIDPRVRNSYDVHADGHILPDSLTVGLTYVNGNYLTIYDVMASLAIGDDSLTLHLEKDPTLYEQPFTVNPGNYLSLMRYRNLEERHLNTRARMQLRGPRDLGINLYTRANPNVEEGNQLLLMVRDLDLRYALQLMQWDGDVSGRYNMLTTIDLFPDSLHARLRSGIRDLRMGDYHADTLAFDGIADMGRGLRDLSGKLTVDSIVKLNVDAHLADSLYVDGWIEEFPLPLANAFMPSYMQLSGNTSGRLGIRGSDLDHARVDAYLTLQEAGLNYNDLDAQLRFSSDTIRLRNNRLLLDDYHIYAANQNPATVRGQLDFSREVSDPTINLQITGEEIRLIDNRRLRLPNQYITGRLPISPNIRVRGSLSNLNVSGQLNVLSGTNLDYYMSDDPLQSSSRVDQLVEFVNFQQIDRMMAQSGNTRRAQMRTAETGDDLTMGLKIEVARDAKISAHLAGTDNNRVDLVGGGSMNLQTDNEGDLIMTGAYNIASGKVNYKLPILPMVKTFSISSDSRVLWSGIDPTDPEIDIKATEEVRTTVNDASGSRLVKFLVTISISGTLEALTMTFDCDAPEDGAISSDIATLTPDERSKTAMMLLITQTYVGPGATSSVGLGTANAALNSMLNREMDSMLGNMEGTNIDVGIDTYATESGMARTNYSVKVSQQLFNDRFRATIGGQISSGGEVGQSQGAKLGDMSLEWLINHDGSQYLKLFRRTNYESVLEGELIETGISYIQERTAYQFPQLLLPTSKKREERLRQIIREMQAKEEEQQEALNNE